jgi:hypothetical protein
MKSRVFLGSQHKDNLPWQKPGAPEAAPSQGEIGRSGEVEQAAAEKIGLDVFE